MVTTVSSHALSARKAGIRPGLVVLAGSCLPSKARHRRQGWARHIDTWSGTSSGISISPVISKPNPS